MLLTILPHLVMAFGPLATPSDPINVKGFVSLN